MGDREAPVPRNKQVRPAYNHIKMHTLTMDEETALEPRNSVAVRAKLD